MQRTLGFASKYAVLCGLLSACGGSDGTAGPGARIPEAGQTGTGGQRDGAGVQSATGGKAATGGKTATGTGGSASLAGRSSSGMSGAAAPKPDAGAPNPDAGTGAPQTDAGTSVPNQAGNPDGKCSQALPAEAQAADSSHPTTVVGTGDAASCSFDKLAAAIAKAGVITFDCGSAPVSIAVSATLELAIDKNTVIDGANLVTLDGGGKVRIMEWNSLDWQKNTNVLTLQHLTLANGKASGTKMIPMHPAPCSQGYNDGMGGGLNMRDGALHAIDVTFLNNQAAQLGPDTGGGAVYMAGSHPAYIVNCTFKGNTASNGGATASQHTTNFIFNSLFVDNKATGTGANNNDPSMCSEMNNGQNEIGSGGNGGAVYNDGEAVDVNVCGTEIKNNMAGAFGAAIFFTSNTPSKLGTLNIRDSSLSNNIPVNMFWEWKPGISTNANTPDPINSNIAR